MTSVEERRRRPATRELTPLETAARDSNTAAFLGLLGATEGDLSMPLFLASKAGALDIVQALLASDRGAKFGPGPAGRTALYVSITHGHLGVVEALAASPLFAREPFSEAELSVAIEQGRPEILRLLMRNSERFVLDQVWSRTPPSWGADLPLRYESRLQFLAFRWDRKRLPEAPFTRALLEEGSLEVARRVLRCAVDEEQLWAVQMVLERYPGGEALPQPDDRMIDECLAQCASYGWADVLGHMLAHGADRKRFHVRPVAPFGLQALKRARNPATLRLLLAHPRVRPALRWVDLSDRVEKPLFETLVVRTPRKRYQPLLECLLDELSPEELEAVLSEFAFPEGSCHCYGLIHHKEMPIPTWWFTRMMCAALDGRLVRADALRLLLDRVLVPSGADLSRDDPLHHLVAALIVHNRAGFPSNAAQCAQEATLRLLLEHPAMPPLSLRALRLALASGRSWPKSPWACTLRVLLESPRAEPLSREGRDELVAGVEELAPDLLPLAIRFGAWGRRGPLVLLRSLVATERASPPSVSEEADPFARFLVCAAPRQVFRVVTQFL